MFEEERCTKRTSDVLASAPVRHRTMLIFSDMAFLFKERHRTGTGVRENVWIKLRRSEDVSCMAVTIIHRYLLLRFVAIYGIWKAPMAYEPVKASKEGATLNLEAADSRMFCASAYASR